MSKAGRNEPCPCGSGKKYKKCCLQKEFVQPGREESIKRRINQSLLELFRRLFDKESLEDAFVEFWGDFDPATLSPDELRMSDINFHEWLVHDWVDATTGDSLVDIYVKTARVLPLDEKSVLNKIKESTLSLFDVMEVFPDKGLLLNDLLLGGEHDVREKAATASLRKWDIIAARVIELDGQKILSGAVYPYPRDMKADILGDYEYGFKKAKSVSRELTMREFMKEMGGHYCNFHWYEIIENPVKTTLTNTDGHLMVISKAFYDVADKAEVIESLRSIKALSEHEGMDRFDWLGKRNEDGQYTLLGTICFERKHMVLETNSKERLKRGKALIKKHIASDSHSHAIDAFEDIDRLIEDRQGRVPASSDDIPLEVQEQVYQEFMDKHYKQWMKDRIPALDDKTPKQAMRSKKGRLQVIELLKQMENMEYEKRRAGQPFYDFGWMWDELGISMDD